MSNKKLLFLQDNQFVPAGQVFTTARKGTKWYSQVEIGDVLDLVVTETDETFGRVVVTAKSIETYGNVLRTAGSNCCAFGPKCGRNGDSNVQSVLSAELNAAYGLNLLSDTFSQLYLVRIKPEEATTAPGVSDDELREAKEIIQEFQVLAVAGQQANRPYGDGRPLDRVRAVQTTQQVGNLKFTHRVEF